MTTGYTAKLADEGQSFEDFVLGCARAFGPCISMREDSLDTPIPEVFERSIHHTEELNKALKLQKELADMTAQQQLEHGAKQHAKESERLNEWYRETLESNERLDDMESLVTQWTPPSKDHRELKKFMLQQIGVSKRDDSYVRDEITKHEAMQPIDYYKDACAEADRNVAYHQDHNSKEAENTEFSNRWVQQLRESLTGGK